MVRRIGVAVIALVALPTVVAAQESRVYVGGSVNAVTQTHSDFPPMGGTTRGGTGVFGVQVSPRVALEVEPSFGGPNTWAYTYRPSTMTVADVVARRRDSFYSIQVRTRVGVLEPVVGGSYVHGRISRHATVSGRTYFEDSRTDHGLAVVAGLDGLVKIRSHFYFVPTFRLFARAVGSSSGDPLDTQTRTGPFAFRYGVGFRVNF